MTFACHRPQYPKWGRSHWQLDKGLHAAQRPDSLESFCACRSGLQGMRAKIHCRATATALSLSYSPGKSCHNHGLLRLYASQVLRVGDSLATRARHPNFEPTQPWVGGGLTVKTSSFAGNNSFIIGVPTSSLPPTPTDWSGAKIFAYPGKNKV